MVEKKEIFLSKKMRGSYGRTEKMSAVVSQTPCKHLVENNTFRSSFVTGH